MPIADIKITDLLIILSFPSRFPFLSSTTFHHDGLSRILPLFSVADPVLLQCSICDTFADHFIFSKIPTSKSATTVDENQAYRRT